MDLIKMTPSEIIKYVKSSKEEEVIKMLDTNLPNNIFKLIYFNISEEKKLELLDNDDLFKKILEILKEGIKLKILKNFTDEFLVKLFKKISLEDIKLLGKSLDDDRFLKITQKLDEINKNSSNLNKQMKLQEQYYSLKVDNPYQLEIYTKYHLPLKVVKNDDELIIDNKYTLPYSFFIKLNDKRINKLIKLAKQNNPSSENSIIFVTIIKMYSVFGYDNSYKILQNKFTYRTDASIKRIAADNFVDQRRQFRIDNQHMFYSYDLATKALIALKKEDYEFFIPYCRDTNKLEISNFINNLKVIYNEFSETKDEEKLRNILEPLIKTEIIQREEILKQKYIQKYFEHYKKLDKRESLDIKELYNILANVDIRKFKIEENGKIIIDKALNEFLLGNTKSDNDAILRLVLNKDAFGLNDALDEVINDFSRISHIIYRNKNLSLKSLLDVIDVCKAKSYNLLPNEEDMTLDTISKIMKSVKHCTESKEEIFRRTRKLHVESKTKVAATIPLVSGVSTENIKYGIMDFGDASVLSLGIDAGCCLKVGGKGEDFLEYLMKSPHGVILYLIDEDNKLYICPFIRNGNGVFGNGIDPMPEDEIIASKLLNAVKEACENMVLNSNSEEMIEFATITDLHQEEFLKTKNLEEMKIETYLPINATFYSDYHKSDKKTYIVYSITQKPIHNSYEPKLKFYQKRKEPFVFDYGNSDKERVEQVINSINYTSIDYQEYLTEKQKNTIKRNYKKINIDDYTYIIGNKDWFIAINENGEVFSKILPYDERARIEYFNGLQDIKEKYSNTKRR